MAAMKIRGVVQRLIIDPKLGTFAVQYRTRSVALFAESEWGWGSKADAYIFPEFSMPQELPAAGDFAAVERLRITCAEAHARLLKSVGEDHVHPVVFTAGCEAERNGHRGGAEARRMERVLDTRTGFESRASEEVYAATSRRLGERES